MNKNLILVGGGGHCKSVIDVAESAGYAIMGVLDKPEELGKSVLSYKVIGTDDDIPAFVDKAEFVITVGQIKTNMIRKKIARLIDDAGGKLATIIAQDAAVSKYAEIGEGTVIMHKCVVNAGAKIGKNCINNTMADIEHDAEIGDFCHVSTGVMVNGGAKVGCDVFIGSGSVVYNCVSVCSEATVAAGSVVIESINQPNVYFGCPAKSKK